MLKEESFEVLVDHADKYRDRVVPNPNRKRLMKPRVVALRELKSLRCISAAGGRSGRQDDLPESPLDCLPLEPKSYKAGK